jgi:hypothetical protein
MYIGKQHSEETRLKIAAKTKEAMLRRKMEKANGNIHIFIYVLMGIYI